MTEYELRAEHQHNDPDGPETVRWHIARKGASVAICEWFFPTASQTRPIGELHAVPEDSRCLACAEWWEAVEQVWAEGSPREPEP